MCEVLNSTGKAHESNGRALLLMTITISGLVLSRSISCGILKPTNLLVSLQVVTLAPQGPYYCSVGANNAYGREIVEEHLDVCLEAGLNVEGINAEVAAGQWEFQIFSKGAKDAGDQIWVARYLLERIGESYGVAINWHCKPLVL
jgi:glutamine synthetase